MRTDTEVTNQSTGFETVIRIEDDGVLVEDTKKFDADHHVVMMYDLSATHLKAAERAYRDALDAHNTAGYILTQNVWSKRGGAR